MTSEPDIRNQIVEWVLVEGTKHPSIGSFVIQYCDYLNRLDLAVDRIFVGTLVVNPQAAGCAVSFSREQNKLNEFIVSHEQFEQLRERKQDPMQFILSCGQEISVDLEAGDCLGMADLEGLKEAGYTEFLGLPLMVGQDILGGITFTTLSPGGWSEGQRASLRHANKAVGPVVMLRVKDLVQATLLKAYLGADAGNRVHRGQVRRGQSQTLTAAIWFCDVRGFTALSQNYSQQVVLDLLNEIFGVLVEYIQAEQGQVLKFMGDGILAIFTDSTPEQACGAAQRAALGVQKAIDELNARRHEEGRPSTGVGIGLHYGDVMYGNIGSPGRLDFTVIGSAVNLAARVESLCSGVGKAILMSDLFRGYAKAEAESCGEYQLKGVHDVVEVFSPTALSCS